MAGGRYTAYTVFIVYGKRKVFVFKEFLNLFDCLPTAAIVSTYYIVKFSADDRFYNMYSVSGPHTVQ